MKAYWITLCQVTDDEGYGEYIKLAGPAIEKFGGKYLIRGGKFFIIEGKHDFERNVIVEFPSVKEAEDCYNSSEYQEAKSFRIGKADFNAIIIEGY